MITFETQEDFESAVMAVVAEKLGVQVHVRGNEFVKRVSVQLVNNDDPMVVFTKGVDSV